MEQNPFRRQDQQPEQSVVSKYKKVIIGAVGLAVLLIAFALLNPFSYNESTERTVVTQASGKQFVQFKAGIFYSGFFSKEQSWPNQISVSYTDTAFDGGLSIHDNTIEIGIIRDVRFNDATTASMSGITQFILPVDARSMLEIHNAHKTPEALVQRRLAPYTVECLKSSAQLMSSEMHYSGGRAQLTQDYMDQLKNGSYLLNIRETYDYDSTENVKKRIYSVQIQSDANGARKRKFSSIKEYAVVIGDAQIIDVDYEAKVDDMLGKKITAATDASVSKQRLMTAQQKAMTAEAEGKQRLVEIEYQQKQEQTVQVVKAQTQVELAKQDLIKQDIALQASGKEAAKIKTLADAEAYAKQRVMQADGALDKKIAAYVETQKYWANAFKDFQGNLVPSVVTGGSGANTNAINWMEIMGMRAASDLSLDLKNKKN
jgi:hypothetical protein